MSDLRSQVIRLAHSNAHLRGELLPLLKMGKVFPTEQSLKTYLEDHPKADPHNHSVDTVERQEGEKPSEAKDTQKIPDDATVKDLPKQYKEEISDYKMEVVGTDAKQALEIARKVKQGIDKAADICKISPSVCKGNKGLTRDKMPQIEGEKSVKAMLASMPDDKFKSLSETVSKARAAAEKEGSKFDLGKAIPDKKEQGSWLDRAKGEAMVQAGADPKSDKTVLQNMLDHFEKNGIKTKQEEMDVGRMKATQSEIKAAKVFGMADAHLRGKFNNIDDSVVVSKDGHILDGHHRWAALLTIDPSRSMKVKVIDMTMDDLLKEAASFPGVYKADFAWEPVAEKDQKEYK